MHLRPRFGAAAIGLAALVAFARLAEPSPPEPDITGRFDVAGKSSSRGDYTGSVSIKPRADGRLYLSAYVRFKAGGTGGWYGYGRPEAGKVTFEGKTRAGMVDILEDKKDTWKGTYAFSDGNKLTGTWQAVTSGITGSDTLTREVPKDGDDGAPAADLITLRDGDGKAIAKDKKKTDGALLAVNLDDDDKDGGAGGDGQVVIKTDREDANGVSGENDLLAFDVERPASAPANATLKIEFGSKIAVWRSAQKNPGTQVKSGDRLEGTKVTLHAEGLAHGTETVTAKLESNGKVVGQDRGVFQVARSAFLLVGHGCSGTYYLKGELGSKKSDGRTNPWLLRGKDDKGKLVAWAVYIFDTEKGAKIALSTEGACIAYDGHSNFGLGYAFETHFKSIREFMNIAGDQQPVNWPYLREHQEHPDLWFQDSEYADDAATPTFSDPVQVARTIAGKNGKYDTARFPVSGGSGMRFPLVRGAKKFHDRHYLIDESQPNDPENYRIVVKAGSRDMPAKRWSKLFLNSCYGGQYYYDSFGGRGTLFFTTDEASSAKTSTTFLLGCVNGESNDKILADLNKQENINDYYVFSGD